MSLSTTLILHHTKVTRCGMNALMGALDTDPDLDALPIEFPSGADDLAACAAEALRAGRRAVVAFSFTTARRDEVADTVRQLRATTGAPPPFAAASDQSLLVIGGGPHPTALPGDALEAGLDAVARGEAERIIVEFMARVTSERDWRETPGIAFRGPGGEIVRNPRPPRIDLDRYPPFSAKRHRYGNIEITRGCPYHCAFCQVSQLHGGRPRHRAIDSIAQAAAAMARRNMRDYRFVTSNAFSYGSPDGRQGCPEAVEALLRAVRQTVGPDRRIYYGSFPSEVRPEHVTPQLVGLVRQYADNDNLVIGGQSGSERLLDSCRRGHDVAAVRRATRYILDAGLMANVDIIFGLPDENESDREATLALIDDLTTMGARIHTHTFLPLPQTAFAKERPGTVDVRTRRLLQKRLFPKGLAYGDWDVQESLARAIQRPGKDENQ